MKLMKLKNYKKGSKKPLNKNYRKIVTLSKNPKNPKNPKKKRQKGNISYIEV